MALNFSNLFTMFARSTKVDNVGSPRSGFAFFAGVPVNHESAMKVAAFYRGVIYIATQLAKLPWDIKDRDYNLLEEDAVYKLLNLQPNPEMNSFNFRVWAMIWALIDGNSYAEIERSIIGNPIAIWPLPRGSIQPYRDERGKLWYRTQGANSEQILLEPRDVLHFKNFHTIDGLTGEGLIAWASRALGITISADIMAAGLFANGGLPSGVLKHKGTLSDEAYKRLKESWKEQYGGKNAGGVAILEEGTEFQPLDIDPQVLQFLESRKFGVLEIARYLGISPIKLFDITATTYSNVENANLEVATDTLDAWAANMEQEVDVKLLNKRYGGKFSVFNLYEMFRGDMKTRSEYFGKQLQNGAITPNEIRNLEGRPGYKGGTRFYLASNNLTPADRIDDVLDAQIKSQTKPATPAKPAKTAEEKEKEELENKLTKAALETLTK